MCTFFGTPCIYIYIYVERERERERERVFPNLIRTSFADFLNEKKLVRGSNPHLLWEDDAEDKDDSDWVTDSDSVMSDDGESDE